MLTTKLPNWGTKSKVTEPSPWGGSIFVQLVSSLTGLDSVISVHASTVCTFLCGPIYSLASFIYSTLLMNPKGSTLLKWSGYSLPQESVKNDKRWGLELGTRASGVEEDSVTGFNDILNLWQFTRKKNGTFAVHFAKVVSKFWQIPTK